MTDTEKIIANHRGTGEKAELDSAEYKTYSAWQQAGRQVMHGQRSKYFIAFGRDALFHISQTKERAAPKQDTGELFPGGKGKYDDLEDDIPF